MTLQFYKENLKAAKESDQKNIDVLKSAVDLGPENVKIEEKSDTENLFIDENDENLIIKLENKNDIF